MSLKAELALKSALLSTGLVQPVDSKVRKNRIEVLCRQVPGQEKVWLEVVEAILKQADSELSETDEIGHYVHLCRRYVYKGERMVFGWHVQVEADKPKDLQAGIESVIRVLALAKPQLEEAAPKDAPKPPTIPRQTVATSRRPLAPGQHPPPRTPPPRQPQGGPGTFHEPPPDVEFGLRVVKHERGADGKETIIEEMPLPHIHRELNVPTKPIWNEKLGKFTGGKRGAEYTGG